jgi:outer membrane protein TolC
MTKAWRISSAWALCAVLGTITTAAQGQQQQQTAPPTPRTQTPLVERYVVGRALPPEVPGSPIMDMTLEQAVAIALEKNLGLQSAKLNPILQDLALAQTRATFNPRFTGTYSFSDNRSVSENTTEGVFQTVRQNQGFNGGISKSLNFHGASMSANWNNGRNTSNTVTSSFNPTLNSSVNVNFSMPLLRNFKIDGTRNSLRTAPINRLVADVQLQQTISQTSTQVRNAYWALRQAIEQIEIAKMGLEMSRRTLEDTKLRVDIGTAAPIDIVTPDLSVANAEQAQLQAEINWRNAELTLKNLLIGGIDDELNRATINPIDRPVELSNPPQIDVQAAMQAALANRTDVTISRKNLESQELTMEVTKNAVLPQLNLSTGYNLAGTDGVRTQTIGGVPVITHDGSWFGALSQISGLDSPGFNMSFNFQYNLGMRAEKANLASSQIRLDQARLQLKNQELTIQNEITRLALNVDNTYKQFLASRKAREVAEKNLEAELTRLDVGLSNNFTVATVQERLTAQRLAEINAIIRYINAVADFERAQKFPG